MPDSFDYSITNSENDAPSYTKETGSRNAEILKSIINDTEYTDAPQSEIEELLLELKEKIAGGGGGGRYSTDEQVVGTWIDGSTIYQKTISLVVSSTDTIIPYTDDVELLVKSYGIFSDSSGAQTFFPYTDGEDYASIYKHASNGIHLLCSNWFINNRPNVTLTLQYTKVTV